MFQQEIITSFTEESWEKLDNISFRALFLRLQIIKNKITVIDKQQKAFFTFKTRGKTEESFAYARLNKGGGTQNDRELLFEAYEIIQAIRQKMTGEVLSYRLFITTPNQEVKYVDIGSKDLRSLLSLNAKEIDISVGELTRYMTEKQISADTLFTEKYKKVMTLFEPKGSFWRIPSINTPPLIMHRKKNGDPGSPIVYTKGHILEALNKTINNFSIQLLSENGELTDDDFIKKFAVLLGYDSVSGFKGGDDSMVQIKANAARLMRYTSIMNAINTVLNIQTLILSKKNNQEIADAIRNMYANSGANNSVNKITDEAIDKIIDDLLKVF